MNADIGQLISVDFETSKHLISPIPRICRFSFVRDRGPRKCSHLLAYAKWVRFHLTVTFINYPADTSLQFPRIRAHSSSSRVINMEVSGFTQIAGFNVQADAILRDKQSRGVSRRLQITRWQPIESDKRGGARRTAAHFRISHRSRDERKERVQYNKYTLTESSISGLRSATWTLWGT